MVDPGQRVVVATGEGYQKREETVTIAEGESKTMQVGLLPAPKEPPPPPPPTHTAQRIAGYALLGAGGAGIVVGAVAGGLSLPKRSALLAACKDNVCSPSLADDVAAYNRLKVTAIAGFAAGGALAAAGGVLLITIPRAAVAKEGALAPVVGPTYLGVKGAF
jgi:hypothetical protein